MAYITLNKKHFFTNLDIITKQTKAKEKIAIVLKDNAYGHGLLLIAQMASEYGITKCVVQTTQEAQKVKKFFEYILILNDTTIVKDSSFYYTINSLEEIKNFPPHTNVELKIDTGMHRNGINPSQLQEAFTFIVKHKLNLHALFTHHRDADMLTSEWFWQKKKFETLKKEAQKLAKQHNLQPLAFHSANSAALFRETDFNEDMVRVGIAAYGCLEMQPSLTQPPLQPILSLYGTKISSRVLQKAQRVGYGATYCATKNEIVSTYNVGYGDGFLRILSNNFKTPQNIKLLGRISMDSSTFEGDKETLLIFDNAKKVAKFANTISYEILTSLKKEIEREWV